METTAYVDDRTLAATSPAVLEQALRLTEAHDASAGWEFNAKSVLATSKWPPPPSLEVAGHPLAWQRSYHVVGHSLHLGARAVQDKVSGRIQKAVQILTRLRSLPYSMDSLAALAATVATTKAVYGATTSSPTLEDLRLWRRTLMRLLWRRCDSRCCVEIVLTMLVPGHRLDPWMASSHYIIAAALRTGLFLDGAMHWVHIRQSGLPHGLVAKVGALFEKIGWQWHAPGELLVHGVVHRIPSPSDCAEHRRILHLLREDLRLTVLAPVASRRNDMRALMSLGGPDFTRSTAWLRSTKAGKPPPYQAGILRALLCGAVWSRCRLFKIGKLKEEEITCKRCSEHPEDVEHLLWECPCNRAHHALLPHELLERVPCIAENYSTLCNHSC